MDYIQTINKYIQEHSNFDLHRNYLGMSKISDCPRRVAIEFLNGSSASEFTYRMSYAGYEQEHDVLVMLIGSGIAKQTTREIVSPFDSRLRGHIDAETTSGDLLEIKSVSTDKFRKVFADGRPLLNHFIQVQLYMLYGHYSKAVIVYRCRETYEHLVYEVPFNPTKANGYELKAKRILDAIDGGLLPTCECGRCKA